jgi:hypothetical protein
MAASESGGSALPGPVPSFKIGQRVWKLGEPIHSIGTAAVEKKKMVETYGDQYATARVEGSVYGTWVWEEILCEMDQSKGRTRV